MTSEWPDGLLPEMSDLERLQLLRNIILAPCPVTIREKEQAAILWLLRLATNDPKILESLAGTKGSIRQLAKILDVNPSTIWRRRKAAHGAG